MARGNQFVLPFQILPVGVAKGWSLQSVVGGLRLWDHCPPLVTQKVAPNAAGKSSTLSLLASVCKVELLPQVCLESMTVCVCVCVALTKKSDIWRQPVDADVHHLGLYYSTEIC